MIKQEDVIEFFNNCAPTWDAEMIRSDEKIKRILDNANVWEGSKVLDVACGTGVLVPDYLKRKVGFVTGIDISPEMLKIAQEKFEEENVRFICGDVENTEVGKEFDCIMIYNAFPHFPEPERLIFYLSGLLKHGGVLSVAHGMSREKIDSHHHGFASKVSDGLMEADKLAEIFAESLEVITVISDENMYQVAGRRK